MFPDFCVCVIIVILLLVLETPSSGVCLHCLIGSNYEFFTLPILFLIDHLLMRKLISQFSVIQKPAHLLLK
jgi:hypothetical protein